MFARTVYEEHTRMIAVHEPDAMERKAWRSTDAREALSCLSALDDHEADSQW
jgi:hypothetical protein